MLVRSLSGTVQLGSNICIFFGGRHSCLLWDFVQCRAAFRSRHQDMKRRLGQTMWTCLKRLKIQFPSIEQYFIIGGAFINDKGYNLVYLPT